MPQTRNPLSFAERERAAERLRAAGHPIRLGIIEYLAEHNAANVTAIHSALEIEQAAASHHLRIMRNADLVQVERVGKTSIYSLADARIAGLLELLG